MKTYAFLHICFLLSPFAFCALQQVDFILIFFHDLIMLIARLNENKTYRDHFVLFSFLYKLMILAAFYLKVLISEFVLSDMACVVRDE